MNPALTQVLFIGVLVAAFYMLVIRPQQQQRKRHTELVEALRPGTRVMTIGGIYGTVVEVLEDDMRLEVADGVVVDVLRSAVARIADETAAETPAVDEDHAGHDDPIVGDSDDAKDDA